MTIRQAGIAAILAFAAVALAGVWLRPLIPIDETRYLSVAWEMRTTGDWLIPHKNGAPYTDKPPLLFWFVNLVWSVTGVSEVAARLVGPAFAVLCLGGTWMLGRRLWEAETGARAAVVLAGMTVFVLYGGATMFDTLLGFAVILGIAALHAALTNDPATARRSWILYGLAIALGVYAKGPVILVHLLPPLLAYPLWTAPGRPAPPMVARGAGLALAVALAVVALWVLPAALFGGAEYRRMILWEQSSGRMVSSFAHARAWWFLLATLPVLLFPWIWSPVVWRGLTGLRLSDPGLRLCLIWAGSGLVLFSLISGKQVHYLIPELPAAALVLSRALAGRGEGSGRTEAPGWGGIALPGALVALGAVAAVLASAGLFGGDAALLRPVWTVLPLAALVIAALAGLRLLPALPGLAGLGLGAALALQALVAVTGLGPAYDSRAIAALLAQHEAGGLAVAVPKYHAEFNFTGRLTQPVAELAAADAPAWLAAHPQGRLLGYCADAPVATPAEAELAFNGKRWCLWAPPPAP